LQDLREEHSKGPKERLSTAYLRSSEAANVAWSQWETGIAIGCGLRRRQTMEGFTSYDWKPGF
jgi:hypothetical protein